MEFVAGATPFPFKSCTTIGIYGNSGCGKTTFVRRLLEAKDAMFTDKLHKCLYCFGIWTDAYTGMEESIPEIEFHKGLPTMKHIESFADGKHNCVIMDDLFQEVCRSSWADQLFFLASHHLKLTIIFLSQNLFPQGKAARNIALNMHYICLFHNPRDVNQIGILGSQLGDRKDLIAAYQDATNTPYGYIILDLTPGVTDNPRWRTKVFPGENTISYQ